MHSQCCMNDSVSEHNVKIIDISNAGQEHSTDVQMTVCMSVAESQDQ